MCRGVNVSRSALKFIEINDAVRFLSKETKQFLCFHIFTDAGGILKYIHIIVVSYYYEICKEYGIPIMCYGLCLNIIENHNWDENNIKKYISKNSQFELIKSDGGETNICSKYNRNYFIKKVLRDFPDGIHLFTADGEYTGTSHDNNVYLFKLGSFSI